MKISLLQFEIVLGDFARNCRTIDSLCMQAMQEQPDTLVLPEMWNIGFFPRPIQNYADENGLASQEFLRSLALKYAVNVVGGSIARKEGANLYNTCYVYNRQGVQLCSYDKIHLFSPAKEHLFFTAGSQLKIFELDGFRCAAVICYDLRFCEAIRLLALNSIDILFIPAAWPKQRQTHWQILNQARAIENQIYIAAVNSSGAFGDRFPLCGNSMLIDPWGEIIAVADEKPQIITGVCPKNALLDIRKSMHIFNDRKPDSYRVHKRGCRTKKLV